MNLNEYQELAARTIPYNKERTLRVAEFSVGLCEEAGESAGVLKKVVFHGHPMTPEKLDHLIEELGDTLWHILALATEFDISFEHIATRNLEKLKRRYPNGFTSIDSLRRIDVIDK